jgi:2'-5' RNA ligase
MRLRPGGAEVWKGGIAVVRIEGGAALAMLHGRLGAVLSRAGVMLDVRPFSPHVTLARKAAKAEPAGAPPELDWCAEAFALVESTGGAARYEILERFAPA